MNTIINWDLMKHPANWVILFLMVFIAAYGAHLILSYWGAEPAQAQYPTGPNRKDYSQSTLVGVAQA